MNHDLETLQLESAKVADLLGVSELDKLVEEYPRYPCHCQEVSAASVISGALLSTCNHHIYGE